MRRVIVSVLAVTLFLGILSRTTAQPQVTVATQFDFIRQGHVGVVTLSGADVAGGIILTLDRAYPFFPTSTGFAALLAVPLDPKLSKEYPMTVTVYLTNGETITSESLLRVESGEYISEKSFVLPKDKVYLLDLGIQTNEDYRLRSIYGMITAEKFWEGRFNVPLSTTTTSPFGSVRTFNDGTARRHTGVDFRVGAGVPIATAASGRVVFARALDIHGNSIIIDHGWGVFSSYSHLSEMYVVPGQIVLQGEMIGLTGNTGRSIGAHLHWEIAVNGLWVSPLDFLQVTLPN